MSRKVSWRLLMFSFVLAGDFLFVRPINSQAQEQGLPKWSVQLGAGALFYERDEEIETGAGLYELKGAYNFDPRWTIETTLGYMPHLNANQPLDTRYPLSEDSMGMKFAVDGMYHLDEDVARKWDPYLTFGGGLLYYEERLENDQHWDLFFGPGFGAAYWFNNNWALRADYRYYVTGHDTESNHHTTLALAYRWGGSEKVAGGDKSDSDMGIFDGRLISDLHIIYFAFDSAELSEEAVARLKQNAQWLTDLPDVNIILEGHCDERGTNEYNMALGERRASAAYDFLIKLGVPAERLGTVSYGEEVPADPGHNEAAWAKNRRVQCVGRGQ